MHSSTLILRITALARSVEAPARRKVSCVSSIGSGLRMAVQEANHHDAKLTLRIACALPLVNFDWKLKYAVASSTIAAVNKPLVRLELYASKAPSKVEEAGLGTVFSENQIQPCVAEFSKAQLDALLGAMDAVEQGLAGAENAV